MEQDLTKSYRTVARSAYGPDMSFFFEEAIAKLTADNIRKEWKRLVAGQPSEFLLTLGAEKLSPDRQIKLCALILQGRSELIRGLF